MRMLFNCLLESVCAGNVVIRQKNCAYITGCFSALYLLNKENLLILVRVTTKTKHRNFLFQYNKGNSFISFKVLHKAVRTIMLLF